MKTSAINKRVRFLDSTVTAHESFRGNKEYDVSEDDAAKFVRWGVAVEVEPSEPVSEQVEPETVDESQLKLKRKKAK